jgi:hypothetical protein
MEFRDGGSIFAAVFAYRLKLITDNFRACA